MTLVAFQPTLLRKSYALSTNVELIVNTDSIVAYENLQGPISKMKKERSLR